MISPRLELLQSRLAPLRDSLLAHPIYDRIDTIEDLRLFMEHHVFAVWDFMSLLKALQRLVCCVDVPWTPPLDSAACRFVNEIVLGEESDEDGQGGFTSHFELYRRAMRQSGAETGPIRQNLDMPGFAAEIRLPLRPLSVQQLASASASAGLAPAAAADSLLRQWPAPALDVGNTTVMRFSGLRWRH